MIIALILKDEKIYHCTVIYVLSTPAAVILNRGAAVY